jgi:hypothetical protein
MARRASSGPIVRRCGSRVWVGVLACALVLALLPPLAAAADGAAPPATNGELLFTRSVDVPGPGGTVTVRQTLHRIQPDGTGEIGLGAIAGRSTPLGISPDGRRMLWVEGVEPAGSWPPQLLLQVGNPDGSARTTIRDLGPQPAFPSFIGDRAIATWSADGLQIAYLSQGRPFVVDAEGKGNRSLPAPAGRVTSLDWSPVGDQLALVVEPEADEHAAAVWVVDVDGQRQERVYATPLGGQGVQRYPTSVRWSPNGQRLAVVESDLMRFDCDFRALIVIGADGAEPQPVIIDPRVTCALGGLTWSPDGTQLAAEVSDRATDGTSIVRFPVAGGTRVQLTDAGAGESSELHRLAAWRPVPDLTASACPAGAPRAGYPDTAGLFHARAIDCVTWWGVAEGGTDGTFAPTSSVTRGQMAAFVVRALEAAGETLPAPPAPRFSDSGGTVHGERIEQLAEAGIVEGVGGGLFAPGRPVSRAQMAAFLARAEAWRTGAPLPSVPDAFRDDDGRTLEVEINRVSAVGLATGIRGRTYAPSAEVSRGQMASFLARLLDRAVRDGSVSPPQAP